MTLVSRFRALVDALPDGSAVTLPVAIARQWLAEEPNEPAPIAAVVDAPSSWRERIWTCPDETRIGVRELCEATGRSSDWVYRAVNTKRSGDRGRDPLPCRKLDGALTFEAGAVRRWLKASAVIVNPEPSRLRRIS